mgnify:CR=1 FL=1
MTNEAPRAIHHTVSKVLDSPDQRQAFLQIEATVKLLTSDDEISIADVEKALFCLGIFIAFQREGPIGASRKTYESLMRVASELVNPQQEPAEVITLRPD